MLARMILSNVGIYNNDHTSTLNTNDDFEGGGGLLLLDDPSTKDTSKRSSIRNPRSEIKDIHNNVQVTRYFQKWNLNGITTKVCKMIPK